MKPTAAPPPLRPERPVDLLLVDDRRDNLLAMETILERPEYNLVSVQSGQDALAEMARRSFAAVLLDVQMPDMDGFEVARLMRGRAATRHTPILFVTALNKSSEHVFRGYEAGAVDYLFKPLDPDVLIPKIQVFADLSRQRQQLETEIQRRREAESRLASLNRELESKVAARSAELQRAWAEQDAMRHQIVRVQKMEAIGRMAGGIAHDFNNLLTVILGSARLAIDQDIQSKALAADLRAIIDAGERAEHLVGQLSTLCRRTTGATHSIDLNRVLHDLRTLLGRTLGEGVHLEIEPSSRACTFAGNPGQIEQLILNLALNAGEAMASRGTLRLRTHLHTLAAEHTVRSGTIPPGTYTVLDVEDTGVGMDEQSLEHVFEPFFTTKPSHQGLGMSSVYGIVRSHGGHIDAESELGEGTRFSVFFPFRPAEADASPADSHPNGRSCPTGNETILVVEDEDSIRSICARQLTLLGYEVLSASDGIDAEHVISQRTEPIHLVVTDVVMPRMDGAELATRVQRRRPETRFLFMSGFTANRISRSGLKADQIHLLQKPFDMDQLARRVRQCLDSAD